LKLIDIAVWILVIFLIPGSLSQVIHTSETPTQGAFETGLSQPLLWTGTPTQLAFLDGLNQTLLGQLTPMQQAFAGGADQTTQVVQESVLPGVTIIWLREGSTIPSS
jgi:hypothetical protein